jgi:hypothetical protein
LQLFTVDAFPLCLSIKQHYYPDTFVQDIGTKLLVNRFCFRNQDFATSYYYNWLGYQPTTSCSSIGSWNPHKLGKLRPQVPQ